MADPADDDVLSKRASHFNNQRSSYRSSHRSSYRSEASAGPLGRPRTYSDLPYRHELDIDLEPGQVTRTDSDALPSPSSAASPAPNVPYTRSRTNSDAKKTRGNTGKRTSRSTVGSRAGDGRAVEELLARDSWQLYDLNTRVTHYPSPPHIPRSGGRGQHAFGPGSASQRSFTALPHVGVEKEEDFAGQYHRSKASRHAQRASETATKLYTLSYLIFFSIWGTLARVGLQTLTFYPGAPVIFSELWANVAGTFIMGFLVEDRMLFLAEWGNSGEGVPEPLHLSEESDATGYQQAKVRHSKVKKTIPMYIGLATGFCGSFTSFSSFIRDTTLSLSNNLPSPVSHAYAAGNTPDMAMPTNLPRNGGYSFMAVCATIIITITACYGALRVGAHLAMLLDPYTPSFRFRFLRRFLDPLIVFLGWGTWLGAVLLAIFPPQDAWRGQALFACVFAPVGCLLRYYLSIWLNPLNPSFPLGTFAVNMFGTAVLGMAFDLQHVSLSTTGMPGGRVIGCQVLQGIEDGLCGALTTVSTWMSELDGLERRHAYGYGVVSVLAGLCLLVVIMGSVQWTVGWDPVICLT